MSDSPAPGPHPPVVGRSLPGHADGSVVTVTDVPGDHNVKSALVLFAFSIDLAGTIP